MAQGGPNYQPVQDGASTPDERTMAVLAHVLQLVGGWIAPLVIFFIRRQSRFVSFHALQVLLFDGVCILLTMIAMGALFMSFLFGIFSGKLTQEGGSHTPPAFLVAFFAVFWLGFVLIWFVRLLLAVVYGVKAGRGEWAEYPILGRFAKKILNIGPGGVAGTP